jgi:hypothetical protein
MCVYVAYTNTSMRALLLIMMFIGQCNTLNGPDIFKLRFLISLNLQQVILCADTTVKRTGLGYFAITYSFMGNCLLFIPLVLVLGFDFELKTNAHNRH